MGGQARLEKVKDMLKQIDNTRVPLYILTHNRNASTKMWPQNRKLYIMILQQLMSYKTTQEIEDILFSSADYISMKSIKEGDREGSYRKYKSTCAINLIKDVLKECKRYINGGKRKLRVRKVYTKKRIMKNKRTRKRSNKRERR